MTTICTISVPAAEFGLAEAMQEVSDLQVACEPVVVSGNPEGMSLIRADAPNRQQVETAVTSDTTVVDWTRLASGESSWLYRIEWSESASLIRRLLTGAGATVLSATGQSNEWTLRVLYPSREACSEIHTACETYELGITIHSIRDVDSDQTTHHGLAGLTDAQHTALTQAHQMGYFKVPRSASLEAVAEALDISHQAVSERLRRAHDTLIETTIGQHGATQAPSQPRQPGLPTPH